MSLNNRSNLIILNSKASKKIGTSHSPDTRFDTENSFENFVSKNIGNTEKKN